MADGIRIRPQPRLVAGVKVAGEIVNVIDTGRPIRDWHLGGICGTCGCQHECKTYHFRLDNEGTVIVSTTIWDHLRRMPDSGGFEQVNVVAEPPTQQLKLTSK